MKLIQFIQFVIRPEPLNGRELGARRSYLIWAAQASVGPDIFRVHYPGWFQFFGLFF